MITEKAKELHQTIMDSHFNSEASKAMWDELVQNCDPTEDEWREYSEGCYFDAGDLFRLVRRMVQQELKSGLRNGVRCWL